MVFSLVGSAAEERRGCVRESGAAAASCLECWGRGETVGVVASGYVDEVCGGVEGWVGVWAPVSFMGLIGGLASRSWGTDKLVGLALMRLGRRTGT